MGEIELILCAGEIKLIYSRVANVRSRHLQTFILTAAICWATSHLNTGAIAVNSVPSFG